MKKACKYLFLICLILMLLSTAGCSPKKHVKAPVAVNGVMDLTDWDFTRDGAVKLQGHWEFYWKRLLIHESFAAADDATKQTIAVPGKWDDYIVAGKPIGATGFATYRLKLKLGGRDEALVLKIYEMCSSYNLYADGQLISSNGIVGKSLQESSPQYLPRVAELNSKGNEIELILQVSNFYQSTGGAWGSIILGDKREIYIKNVSNVAFDAFISGAIFLMGFFNIIYFLIRRREKSPIYLGVFCFLISGRALITGERLINQLLPSVSWEVFFKAEYISFYAGVVVMLMFLYKLFENVFNQRLIRLAVAFGSASIALVVLTPASIYSYSVLYYQVFTVAVCFYAIFAMLNAAIRKVSGAGHFLVGFFIMSAFILHDVLLARGIIHSREITPIGLTFFIFFQAVILSKRVTGAFDNAERLLLQNEAINAELMELNSKLEEKVELRTRELQDKNEQLERLAKSDSLTGLLNHKHLFKSLEEEIARTEVYDCKLSVIMLDIDYFKRVNDQYGHPAGDKVLLDISALLNSIMRQAAIVGRYGGEEFLAVLPGVELAEALCIAENIRLSVEEADFTDKAVKVTISGGVAERTDEDAGKLVDRVDKLLYKAKLNGRNRIEH